jgi:hypothetical protein
MFTSDSVLKYDVFKSGSGGDTVSYWIDSLVWKTPYNVFHVPLFPLLTALIRGLTFNSVEPMIVMRIISISAYYYIQF